MQEHADDSAGSGEDMQSPRMVSFDTSTAGSESHRGQDAEGDHAVGSGGEDMGAGSACAHFLNPQIPRTCKETHQLLVQ